MQHDWSNTMNEKKDTDTAKPLWGNLLEDRLLHYRLVGSGERIACTLPELFIAMAHDQVQDFPALRPHQRHPWHAFLVQLAAIALHRAERTEPFTTAQDWQAALLALTPDDPDGAAWCLVSPVDRPAFMQAPEPSGDISTWKNRLVAADELDMLITSKNHDLKAARMLRSSPEEWVYALVSLQTQEGFLGSGNYGISRMNGGFASRCGVGLHPNGKWGSRWIRDMIAMQKQRESLVNSLGFMALKGHALIWTIPWDGVTSLSLSSLDPWYIEICRRVRLRQEGVIKAQLTGSQSARIAAKALNGNTGDSWMPIDATAAKALTITGRGFDYKLSSELLLGSKYRKPTAQVWLTTDDTEGVHFVAQGVARGQGKTEGYHERRIPISKTVRKAFQSQKTDTLAKLAEERIAAIGEIRKMLWTALVVLFNSGAKDETGKDKDASDSVKDRANLFAQPFEAECDAKFFQELTEEIEAEDRDAVRKQWLCELADRTEHVLRLAFDAGPRSGQLRYRAQSAALWRLHGQMRSDKSKLPILAQALKTRYPTPSSFTREENHEHA
jgi:CRISPR system Cascade subunit CasA